MVTRIRRLARSLEVEPVSMIEARLKEREAELLARLWIFPDRLAAWHRAE